MLIPFNVVPKRCQKFDRSLPNEKVIVRVKRRSAIDSRKKLTQEPRHGRQVNMTRQTFSTISRCSSAPAASSPKITRDDLLTLKEKSRQEASPVQKLVNTLAKETSAIIASMMAPKTKKVQSMCKYYGHVIHGNNWSGSYPKCADCGAEIQKPEELRKATAR
jgi:hypothetical protein